MKKADNKPHEYDELIIESINNAVDAWIEGGGNESNFVTMIFEEAKRHSSVRGSEWRGAVLLFIFASSGIKLTRSSMINFKLLTLDCLASWQKNVEIHKDSWEKTNIMIEIERIRTYFLKDFGMLNTWSKNVLDEHITNRLRDRVWNSLVGV